MSDQKLVALTRTQLLIELLAAESILRRVSQEPLSEELVERLDIAYLQTREAREWLEDES